MTDSTVTELIHTRDILFTVPEARGMAARIHWLPSIILAMWLFHRLD
jgi:hypothetical protein